MGKKLDLPERVEMVSICFMDGKNGYRKQIYTNEEFGISCINECEGRDSKWTRSWSIWSCPGKEFKTYDELRKYVINTDVKLKIKIKIKRRNKDV